MNKEQLRSVNKTINKDLPPQHAMYELGNVILQIILNMVTAPNTGVLIFFFKIDLKEGYWHMIFNEKDLWNFAYVLPTENADNDAYLVIPYALQTG